MAQLAYTTVLAGFGADAVGVSTATCPAGTTLVGDGWQGGGIAATVRWNGPSGANQWARPPRGGERSTWIAFAGVMMIIIALLDVMWGIAAIANNEVVVGGGHGVIVLGLTGLGLLVGNELARVVGIGLLTLNAVLQVVWFPAAPLRARS